MNPFSPYCGFSLIVLVVWCRTVLTVSIQLGRGAATP
jgi:hypothetical protein